MSRVAAAVEHLALRPAAGRPLDDPDLRDRERLGVLLQGAALLAVLEQAGWRLERGFVASRIADDGTLTGCEAAAGPSLLLPQELLAELTRRLFGGDRVAGRGEARRVLREVAASWRQGLVAVEPTAVVESLLAAAPALLAPAAGNLGRALFGWARRSLSDTAGSAGRELLLAAPRAVAERLRRQVPDGDELAARLAGPLAGELWREASELPLVAWLSGHRRAALVGWEVAGRVDPAERLLWAETLLARGQHAAVVEVARAAGRTGETDSDVAKQDVSAASEDLLALLELRALAELGDVKGQLALLRRAERRELSPPLVVAMAEVAVRLAANSRQWERHQAWVERAREAVAGQAGTPLAALAALVEANAAWDRGEPAAMSAPLAVAFRALADREVAWRWHVARSRQALALDDPSAAVEHAERALARSRRQLPRATAGRLWTELVLARSFAGDLAGAERAAAHAARLLLSCDGPLATTLALPNLAETRLRRGRLLGVEEILAATERENIRSQNLRGLGCDRELRVRLELVRGQFGAALELAQAALGAQLTQAPPAFAERSSAGVHAVAAADAALADLPAADSPPAVPRGGGQPELLRLLAARAFGWLERPREAAAELDAGGALAIAELEPEERPAVWALAGRSDEAWREAGANRHGGLWQAVLAGRRAGPLEWDALAELEPYRAARLIFDVELTAPGRVPPRLVRQAIATLRRVGAGPMAARLEAASIDPWTAVATYLGGGSREAGGLAALFLAAGYGEARVWWESTNEVEVLLAGRGGSEELLAPHAAGTLVLRAPVVDPPLRALFQLVRLDYRASRGGDPDPQVPSANGGGSLRGSDGRVEAAALPRGEEPSGAIVGRSPGMSQALERVARFARSMLPVLVLGETGTGKELAAREVHRGSRRAAGPFLAINCAAFSETLIQSELFGHVRGAFTGADRDRAGIFETARGGTVFLDEIGDLPLAAQGNLLRLLQEGEIRRLGESVTRRVDVRVVAATHRELDQMVERGAFRADLLYRLRVATVRLPPLRERGDDVLALANMVLARAAASGETRRLSPAARSLLMCHSWPGNVRELINVIEAAVALSDLVIEPSHLELPVNDSPPPVRVAPSGDYHGRLEAFRREMLASALAEAGGNLAAAARRLGLTRQALSYNARQLGLDPGSKRR